MGQPIAHIGSTSSHGGTVITGNGIGRVNGIPIATIGCLHSCPIKGHGVTPIVTGSVISRLAGANIAIVSSTTGCGATIISAMIDYRSA